MAITKQAKNMYIKIKNKDVVYAKELTITAKKIIIEAENDNLNFNCSQKIIVHGN